MRMTNRRKSWNNDLFVKFMVSVAVVLIGASYNTLSDFIIANSTFKGEMSQFKEDITKHVKEIESNVTRIDTKQIRRTDNVKYSGLLKSGDTETIERLCKQIIKDTCP